MYFLATFAPIFLLFSVSYAGMLSGLLSGGKDEPKSKDPCSNINCQDTCYRTFDGVCNNLKNPLWGSSNTPFIRLFDTTSYTDGKYKIPKLKNAREISLQAHPDTFIVDPKWTVVTPMWGQFVAHDLARFQAAADISCPCVFGQLTDTPPENERCQPIKIPPNDPYHGPVGTECFNFVRTFSTYQKDPSCRAEQINEATSYLDVSPLYGNNLQEANVLRKNKKGMLDYQVRDGRMYPPQANKLDCTNVGAKDNLCIRTGDVRANQNPHIALIQTILLRYHNDVAETLCDKINPHWKDEKCFQEARRIVIATVQHITYNDFLPFVIGEENVFGKIACNSKDCYDNDYDNSCNAGTGNEFSTAAYRALHSTIVGWLSLITQKQKHECSVRLSDHLGNPSLLLEHDVELKLATGAATQNQMKSDAYLHDEVKQYFFRPPNATFGQDLTVLDIYRNRDHGTPPYYIAIKKCGLGKPNCFDDFKAFIKPEVVDNILSKLYPSYKDVELYVGGLLETNLPGTLTGPTFNCILVEQFKRTKQCDRYWYTNKHQKCYFTSDQLKSIKKGSSISRLLCSYIKGFKKVQRQGFEVISERNPLVDCDDIPCIDLELWQDDSSSSEDCSK